MKDSILATLTLSVFVPDISANSQERTDAQKPMRKADNVKVIVRRIFMALCSIGHNRNNV